MPTPPSLRRLSLSDLDEQALRSLIAHGEDLFVERKQALPKEGIGRAAASFANSLGGWILLGVADNKELVGYATPGRSDVQSHIGQLLANEVEPVPPFVAESRVLDRKSLVIIRVFESSDTPHLLRKTGAVPIRTPQGTKPVVDQGLLLQLARRGEAALETARNRLATDLIATELGTPDRPDIVGVSDAEPYVIVRAALVTPPPHFASWALSQAAPATAVSAANEIARILGIQLSPVDTETTSRGRGVSAGWRAGFHVPVGARVTIDAAGVVGARLVRGRGTGAVSLHAIKGDYVSPLMLGVGDVLRLAEAYGRSVWRVDISLPRQDFTVVDAPRRMGRPFYASGELPSPPDFEASAALTDAFIREFAREMGVEQYE
ncbi:MAG: helix-turn-helix domain-containing protein [Gaiellaceae bacterium]